MNSWQPIGTAPTDGTHVLLYRNGWKWPRSGQWSSGGWWTNGERMKGEPDYWMEMPPLPEAEECSVTVSHEGLHCRTSNLQRVAKEAMHDKGVMAGSIGAVKKYLDGAGVPAMSTVQKRVKLLAAMYQQLNAECERLRILLADKEES